MATWDDPKTLKLIKAYGEHEELWNSKNQLYRNKQHRQETLNTLAKIFEVDQRELERKLKNLTSHYYREMKKVIDPNQNYVSKWFAFDAFKFLKDKNKRFGGITEKVEEDTCDFKDTDCNLEDVTKENFKADYTSSEDDDKPVSSFKTIKPPTIATTIISAPIKRVKKRKLNVPLKRDEFTVLGEEVAMKVRNVRTNYGRCTVKHKIQTILYEAGLGMYDYPPDHFSGGAFGTRYNLDSPATSSTANSRHSPIVCMSPTASNDDFVSIKSEPEILF